MRSFKNYPFNSVQIAYPPAPSQQNQTQGTARISPLGKPNVRHTGQADARGYLRYNEDGRPGGRPGHTVNQGLGAANRENPVLDFIAEFRDLANLFQGTHGPK